MAINQTIETLLAVLNDSATFYEDIAERNNSLVTRVLPSINTWALQANTTQSEINAKAAQVAAQAVDGGYSQNYINDNFFSQNYINSNFVGVNNAQNITAVKTFSLSPIVPNATTATQAMAYGQGVNLTTAQTIAGVKTFSLSPIVPTPTTDTQAANKQYADSKVALAAFTGANVLLSANGYQKLPSGLIIQWGSYTSSSSADSNITFPIAFPNVAQVVLGLVQGSPSQGVFASLGAAGKSSTSFYMGSWTSNSARATTPTFWIAIGY